MPTFRTVVTFEFDETHPLEYRGVHTAGTPDMVAKLALRAARALHPKRTPQSFVIVMERQAEKGARTP